MGETKTALDFLGKNVDSTDMGANGSIRHKYQIIFDTLKNKFKGSNKAGHKLMRDNLVIYRNEKSVMRVTLAFINAFFRKTSKLGLDWANSNGSQLSGVSFMNYYVDKTTGTYSDIMAEGQVKRARYTSANIRDLNLSDKAYYITFSEIRHAMRKKYNYESVDHL
ncbi:hypothetical protein [Serratia sp. M24T3]|uniref:hypothetical protein n=1 Tax=Serratia sp. M24T3 TaxID=932213 RepID=UPI00025B8EF4|nr:hypothetical protein [Serratia sp. M24T3]EIC84529.1 hypothetical protein SPM24T3_11465 [Serratia sp. M24T3]